MAEQISHTITNLRKAGKLQEAWDIGCPAVQENPADTYLKGAFFWLCYAYLKEVQEPIKARAQLNNGNFKPNDGELERINFLLDWVVWLNIPGGGYEYRSLLLTVQKNLEYFPKLVILLCGQIDTLFQSEDLMPFSNEHGESPSLVLKFVRKVAKAWMETDEVRQIDIDRLMRYFEFARKNGKDKQHVIWLDYDEAKCLVMAGRLQQAREFVIPVLRRKQTESWAWGALAATYRKESPSAAITLFSKGLTCAHEDTFSLPLWRGLVPLLANSGKSEEASMCVKRAIACYDSHGWKIKPDLEKSASQPWFDSTVDVENLSDFIEKMAQGALDYLHGPSESCVAIVSAIHKSEKGFNAYGSRNQMLSVRLGLYRSKKLPAVGDYVRLTISVDDSEVISAEPCNAVPLDDVAADEGKISVTPKGFGFVNGTFIPPYLISEGIDENLVKITSILDFDKTKNRHSWKAITLALV